jgi:hypothetical protein
MFERCLVADGRGGRVWWGRGRRGVGRAARGGSAWDGWEVVGATWRLMLARIALQLMRARIPMRPLLAWTNGSHCGRPCHSDPSLRRVVFAAR